MTVMIGAIAVVIVIVLVVMMKGGNKEDPAAKKAPEPVAVKPAPAVAPAQAASAKAGKTPKRPAPALTQETLAKVEEMLRTMKAFYNEGATARQAGDNTKARDKMAQAKDVLEQIDKLLAEPLLWQEEAQMDNWAQPAEYISLEKVYGDVMKLAKMVRMGGGK